jgi:hypothetical protein
MFKCVTCGRELIDDSNYCDICGSLQPRQPTDVHYGGALDVAYEAASMLVQVWDSIPESERVATRAVITTYLLTKSSDTFRYLCDWLNQKANEYSPLDATA